MAGRSNKKSKDLDKECFLTVKVLDTIFDKEEKGIKLSPSEEKVEAALKDLAKKCKASGLPLFKTFD